MRSIPRELVEAPILDHSYMPTSVKRHQIVLINPFYPKDPHASFAKHVLTPSLALTKVLPLQHHLNGTSSTGMKIYFKVNRQRTPFRK